MLSSNEEIILTIALSTVMILTFAIVVIIAILKYRNKQKELLERENAVKIELVQTALEAKEQTLEDLSEKLHIDIQQSLSLAKLNLNRYILNPKGQTLKISETKELIAQTINDIKALSKELDPKYITGHTLEENISRQLERVEKKAGITTTFSTSNIEIDISQDKQIIIYRIIQEAINNILLHAEATLIEVDLTAMESLFILSIKDNGKGFNNNFSENESNHKMGIGLRNMKNRTTLMGGSFEIFTEPNRGTEIIFNIPYNA